MSAFHVLLGPDYAGKTSVLRAMSDRGWAVAAGDDESFPLLGSLRSSWFREVRPHAGHRYSPEVAVAVLHPVVLHLRDQVERLSCHGPVVVDSYYYKLLAKLEMSGLSADAWFRAWRGLPQPDHVVFLDAPPARTWERTDGGASLNALEHYGHRPTRHGFVRFQNTLRSRLFAEVNGLRVTVVDATRRFDSVVAGVERALGGRRVPQFAA